MPKNDCLHSCVTNTVSPLALRMAKTVWSYGRSECKRVKSSHSRLQIGQNVDRKCMSWICYLEPAREKSHKNQEKKEWLKFQKLEADETLINLRKVMPKMM